MAKATPYSDQKNWSNDYLTDPKLVKLLGPFRTDPCCPRRMPWKTARYMWDQKIDGLNMLWTGRVFMNPPYRGVLKWARKFAEHGNGIALLNGRSSETRATQIIMEASLVIWFPAGRLSFFKTNGQPWPQKWFPSLLIGMSEEDRRALHRAQRIYGGVIYERGRLQYHPRNHHTRSTERTK